ncbi:MAG: hypothetical protein RIS86_2028 [Planctomycetota bacterium]|jgi:uncharacterized membrane protein
MHRLSPRPVRLLASVSAATLLAASVALAGGGGRFELIGVVGDTASAVSDDGRVVAGYGYGDYWYWTAKGGLVAVDGATPFEGAGGQAGISADGSRIGITVLNAQGKTEGAFHDVETGVTTPVGNFGASCDLSATSCWGMSGDGTTIVGLGWHAGCAARAFSYEPVAGLKDLGTLVNGAPTRANDCNGDGSVIVGWQDSFSGARQAAVWRNGVEKLVTTSTGAALGEAGAVSADGVWVVGLGSSANGNRAWRFSETTGLLNLPISPIQGFSGYAVDVSDDGSRVLMFYRTPFPPATGGEGYLWDDGELLSLDDLAAEAGIAVPSGVRMALPLAMSGDGFTIVGVARTASGPQSFLLELPRPSACVADLDGDGEVAATDLSILLGAWGTSSPADLDGDGQVDAADLAILLAAWGACA